MLPNFSIANRRVTKVHLTQMRDETSRVPLTTINTLSTLIKKEVKRLPLYLTLIPFIVAYNVSLILQINGLLIGQNQRLIQQIISVYALPLLILAAEVS